MGTRWYQPTSGTFLSRDTYAGELATPFTLNRYTYATNNPINRWDPDGRSSEWVYTDLSIVPGETTPVMTDGTNYWAGETTTNKPLATPVGQTPKIHPISIETIQAQLDNLQIITPTYNDILNDFQAKIEAGLIPMDLRTADLTFLNAFTFADYQYGVDILIQGYQESQQYWAHDAMWGPMFTRDAMEALTFQIGQSMRCGDSPMAHGECIEQPTMSPWEIAIDMAAGAVCVAGVAASPVSVGATAVVGCGIAAAVLAGAADNAIQGKPITDGLIWDAVIGGGTALAGHGLGSLADGGVTAARTTPGSTADTARFAVGSDGTITDLGPRAASGRPVVIGEDMRGRVIPEAQSLSGDVYDPPFFSNQAQSMAHNRYWINEQMNQGRGIVDVGPAPFRSGFPEPTSPWYVMERQQIAQRGYAWYIQQQRF